MNSFLKDLELAYKDLHPNDDGTFAEQGNYIDGYNEYLKEIGPNGLIENLNTPFTEIESLELKRKGTSINIGNDRTSLISIYRNHVKIKNESIDSINSNRHKDLFLKQLNGNGMEVIGRVGDIFNGLTGLKGLQG